MLRRIGVAALFACAVAATAAAQPPAEGRQAKPGAQREVAPGVTELPEVQLAAMLDTYAIVQAQEQLGIADEKYGSFAARLKKLQDVRRRNQRLRRQLVQELRRMVGPRAVSEVDDATIRKQLLALREHDERAAVELRQAYEALDEVLDARQQARFRLFEEHIEQRKMELLMRATERARANKR
jgi:hypothetical protein